MSEKLSERIAMHFDNEPLAPGVRDYWSKRAAALEARLEATARKLERELWIIWEGDESEGRWRCLMCGDTREGEDDTGPEGVQHRHNCGEVGTTVWALDKMNALAAAQQDKA
mgnify:CR=1 FL=1